jgi:hypothetical protein
MGRTERKKTPHQGGYKLCATIIYAHNYPTNIALILQNSWRQSPNKRLCFLRFRLVDLRPCDRYLWNLIRCRIFMVHASVQLYLMLEGRWIFITCVNFRWEHLLLLILLNIVYLCHSNNVVKRGFLIESRVIDNDHFNSYDGSNFFMSSYFFFSPWSPF